MRVITTELPVDFFIRATEDKVIGSRKRQNRIVRKL